MTTSIAGRMQDKVVIITGGASGIGEATAHRMASEGAYVTVADIDDSRGHAVATEIGDHARYVHCDVTDESGIERLVDYVTAAHGRLDCFYANAGVVGASGPIDELTAEEFEVATAVLLRSAFFSMKHAARVMKPQRSGVILATSSIAGIDGGWAPHLYSACKAAIVGLTRNVASELAPFGIRCVALAPGKMLTPMMAGRSTGGADQLARTESLLASMSPMHGRIGRAMDVANAATWLASDEAGYVTGTTLAMDGGLSGGAKEGVTPETLGRWALRP
jgi:NAD(P)-dependent dehydrogenase (short-subunit alcohol dehydrogenase family)